MSYIIAKQSKKRKDGTLGWKVRWEWYEQGRRRMRYVPKAEWRDLGLREGMEFEEAKGLMQAVNRQERLRKQEAKRQAIKRTRKARGR